MSVLAKVPAFLKTAFTDPPNIIHGFGGLDGFTVKPWDPDFGGLEAAKAADPG